MGKFKSVIVVKQHVDKESGIVTAGKTAWVPLDEAAKAHPVVQDAIDAGEYTPAKGESIVEMQARLRKREIEAAQKGKR